MMRTKRRHRVSEWAGYNATQRLAIHAARPVDGEEIPDGVMVGLIKAAERYQRWETDDARRVRAEFGEFEARWREIERLLKRAETLFGEMDVEWQGGWLFGRQRAWLREMEDDAEYHCKSFSQNRDDALAMGCRPGRSDRRDAYQSYVLDVWTQLGGKLGTSKNPVTQEVGGPLFRFFVAVAGPVMGAELPAASSFRNIVRREKRRHALSAKLLASIRGSKIVAVPGKQTPVTRAADFF
jgi:hypothetical protein